MNFEEYVYESLQGTLCDPHPEVKNLFEVGMPCERWYAEMLRAYQRICNRLNGKNEDDDVEIIITNLQRIQRELALNMYRYGAKFKK
jgi:hypothetical protein